MLLFKNILTILSEQLAYYMNIYRMDLRPVCTDGRIAAVDKRSEVSVSVPQETVAVAANFCCRLLSTELGSRVTR